MSDRSEMQFYMSKNVDRASLRDVLATLIGMKIETDDQPDEYAPAVLMTTDYEAGFPLGVSIGWRKGVQPKPDHLAVARRLARHFKVHVATDLPEASPSQGDPYVWGVAEPDGTLVEMTEDVSATVTADQGLRLDPKSRRVIDGAAAFGPARL